MNRTKLVEAIKKEKIFMDDVYCERYADELLLGLDSRLVPNVEQWLKGEELTDIRIGKYSIIEIMGIRDNNDFFDALETMRECIANPEIADFFVWRFRR